MLDLPNKPSELLKIAINDFKEVLKDPAYLVNMSDWHKFNGVQCEVCLAGSVIAKTLGMNELKEYTPFSSFGNDNQNKFLALNAIRMGRLKEACTLMGIDKKLFKSIPLKYNMEKLQNVGKHDPRYNEFISKLEEIVKVYEKESL